MEERIQKIISAAGVTSRRAAEQLITEGRVRLNGTVVTELGTKADASKDHIKVDGKLINPKQPLTYVMLNKPAGFVTTMSDPERRPTVQDLLKGIKVRVYPVGRLDYNTEGMLILTNDGDFAHLITHPKHELPKTYLAKIKGVLEDRQIENLESGIFLDDGKTAPAKIKKVRKEEANSWVEITIHEGRKRQVRRMFDRVGRSVIKLKRIRTGTLTLGALPEGMYRYMTPAEVSGLMEMARNPGMPLPIKEASRPAVASKAREPEETDLKQSRPHGRPRQDDDRVRGPRRVMHETSDGRRRNQRVRPGAGGRVAMGDLRQGLGKREDGRGERTVHVGLRRDQGSRPAFRTGAGSSTTRSATSRPSTGAAPWKSDTRRKPVQDSRSGGSSDSRSVGSGRGEGRTSCPAFRTGTGRSTTRSATSRPSTGAAPWKSDTRRKPAQSTWTKTRPGESRGGGFAEGRRPSSGPRPNRSTHTGSKGPGRGTKFGGPGTGRKK